MLVGFSFSSSRALPGFWPRPQATPRPPMMPRPQTAPRPQSQTPPLVPKFAAAIKKVAAPVPPASSPKLSKLVASLQRVAAPVPPASPPVAPPPPAPALAPAPRALPPMSTPTAVTTSTFPVTPRKFTVMGHGPKELAIAGAFAVALYYAYKRFRKGGRGGSTANKS